jgi:transposase-like protein
LPNSSRGPARMNNPHHGARLTVHSREQIVVRVLSGQNAAEVAGAFAVSVRTVRKWLARFRAGGQAALSNHASAPARVARRLGTTVVALIVHLRRTLATIHPRANFTPSDISPRHAHLASRSTKGISQEIRRKSSVEDPEGPREALFNARMDRRLIRKGGIRQVQP